MRRALFVATAALTAAAIANPVVETISNTGIFGNGYADHDQSSVGPTFAVAVLFALAFVIARTMRALRGTADAEPMLGALARDLARRAPSRELPRVMGLQFFTLYVMERVEGLLHAAAAESGLSWLGGPPVFAIAVHAFACIATTLVLGLALRAIASLLATAVRAVLEAFAIAHGRGSAAAPLQRRFAARGAASLAHVRALRGRAPPFAPALA